MGAIFRRGRGPGPRGARCIVPVQPLLAPPTPGPRTGDRGHQRSLPGFGRHAVDPEPCLPQPLPGCDGDRQADLSVHGGRTKAVYAYPAEHYDFWRKEFPDMELPFGMFGENFTVTGFSESELNIGDEFRVGAAIVRVTEPRLPCYKLGIKFGRSDILKRFLASERTGFYLGVDQEGEVGASDEFQLIRRNKPSVTITEVTRLYSSDRANVELLRRAVAVEALDDGWRSYFQNQLAKL